MAASRANINRALDLIGAPLVLEVLDALGHNEAIEAVAPPGTDPAAISAAVDRLRQAGAVQGAYGETGGDAPTLTALGRRLFDVLESFDATGAGPGERPTPASD
jgi:hypothetical protein